MAEVLVLVDHVDGEPKKVTYELLTLAARLGEPAAVVLAGPGHADAVVSKVGEYGATKAYVVEAQEIAEYLIAP
jgi:electron transfer flavoprotein alpha subunit